MRKLMATLALAAVFAGCSSVRPKDYEADARPPAVERLEAVDASGRVLASAFGATRPILCPDGRSLLGSSIVTAEPVAGLVVVIRDDESGLDAAEIRLEGARPLSVSPSAGEGEIVDGGRVVWTSGVATEPRELRLRLPVTASERLAARIDATDASGKRVSTVAVTFATLAALCR